MARSMPNAGPVKAGHQGLAEVGGPDRGARRRRPGGRSAGPARPMAKFSQQPSDMATSASSRRGTSGVARSQSHSTGPCLVVMRFFWSISPCVNFLAWPVTGRRGQFRDHRHRRCCCGQQVGPRRGTARAASASSGHRRAVSVLGTGNRLRSRGRIRRPCSVARIWPAHRAVSVLTTARAHRVPVHPVVMHAHRSIAQGRVAAADPGQAAAAGRVRDRSWCGHPGSHGPLLENPGLG